MALLPCPFCGAVEPYISVEEVVVNPDGDTWADDGKHRFQVMCGPCAVHGPLCKNAHDAAKHWNTRAVDPSKPDDIRAEGWAVAVHNDYRLAGVPHTFWLFTKGDHAVKGEGKSDSEALSKVRLALYKRQALGAKPSTLTMFGMVGVSEIARKAGVTTAAVSNWRARHNDFPAPIADLDSGPVFDEEQIDAWLQSRKG
jgi:hypothetical protein